MMIAHSEKYSEVYREMERRLICAIWEYGEENGIEHRFMLDSKSIHNSIATIASRVAQLSESVVINKDLIRMQKESKKFETAMKNMSKVDRKLRKSTKRWSKKGVPTEDRREISRYINKGKRMYAKRNLCG
jgi:hypothetical protein